MQYQMLATSSWRKGSYGHSIGDWEDRNGEIAVTLDMPGIQKKDIELTIDKHMIKVKAQTER